MSLQILASLLNTVMFTNQYSFQDSNQFIFFFLKHSEGKVEKAFLILYWYEIS